MQTDEQCFELYVINDLYLGITMFRDDYEKFLKIAKKELPEYIKIWDHHSWFSQVMNINTAALYDINWRDKDFKWWIRIDIFPIDYASKFTVVNKVKSLILLFLRAIMLSQKSDWTFNKMETWKKIFVYPIKCIFSKVDCSKIHKLHDKISKKVFFKWKNIFTAGCVYRFFPANIYDNSYIGKFEDTTICIPNWYDTFLKILYGNYKEPVIWKWWHNCRYSVDKSYKDIIKTFDRSKTNEENYNNCKSLVVL